MDIGRLTNALLSDKPFYNQISDAHNSTALLLLVVTYDELRIDW